ncbi:hypothetical protein GA0115250_13081, partial [Streptomyces sp. BvitLS-983]
MPVPIPRQRVIPAVENGHDGGAAPRTDRPTGSPTDITRDSAPGGTTGQEAEPATTAGQTTTDATGAPRTTGGPDGTGATSGPGGPHGRRGGGRRW